MTEEKKQKIAETITMIHGFDPDASNLMNELFQEYENLEQENEELDDEITDLQNELIEAPSEVIKTNLNVGIANNIDITIVEMFQVLKARYDNGELSFNDMEKRLT